MLTMTPGTLLEVTLPLVLYSGRPPSFSSSFSIFYPLFLLFFSTFSFILLLRSAAIPVTPLGSVARRGSLWLWMLGNATWIPEHRWEGAVATP